MSQTITSTVNKKLAAEINQKIDNNKTFTFLGKGGSIPDGNGSFQDEIVIQDNFPVSTVHVTLKNLTHTWVGDLVVRLHHLESDTVVDLFRRPGQRQFSSSGYCNDLNGDYSFNNKSRKNFESAAAEHAVIPSGNYAPAQPLSVLDGLPSSGTWRLIINDCAAGDSGSLDSWSLAIGGE
ncbi:proprotein convertase P-domain-containing protein [Lyngbya aestuarii]|uniref:proprotein convertase P-domain-containing protein n=1 Tax=Lyngbya aestuarii TaxID=118322 RepID=UPI00403DF377